ncbi:hypothetical protein FHW88_005410 [Mucilaginibacter sp. SG538B]|uniref:hypothetical protein n=1 Tax=unclassified Mucilaginibacter TaxID=2617802 RepID=UPI0008717278|nr:MULTISPECIES: hypothetical protein [unclassified Mucilaginibacter]NVM67089.1 hypothetical protein [Mucilaginibacter sp. SG538B]SCW88264.1 hypothetical protein SAMN03159284_05356 [Mucilaginibacter sp. NFR10]
MPIIKEAHHFVLDSSFKAKRVDKLTNESIASPTIILTTGNQSNHGTFGPVFRVPYSDVYFTFPNQKVHNRSIVNGWSLTVAVTYPKYDNEKDSISYTHNPITFLITDPFHRKKEFHCKADIDEVVNILATFVKYSSKSSLDVAAYETRIQELESENEKLKAVISDIQSKIAPLF